MVTALLTARTDASGPTPAPTWTGSTSGWPATASPSTTTACRGPRTDWPRSRRCSAERPTRFELLTAAAFALVRRRGGGRRRRRGGPRGTLGRHQRGRCRRGGHHQCRLRPHRDARARRWSDIAAREGGDHQAGLPGRDRGDRPRTASPSSGRRPTPAPRRCGCAARDYGWTANGSPSAAGCSTCARPAAPTARSPPAARRATRGTTPPAALAAAEAFFGAPLDDDVVDEALSAVRVPGRMEVVGPTPAGRAGRRPQRGGDAGARPDRWSRSSPSTVRRWPSSACCSGRDPAAMLEALRRRACARSWPAPRRRPRALAGRGRGRGGAGLGHAVRWPRPACRGGRMAAVAAPGPTTGASSTGSLYVVGGCPRACWSADGPTGLTGRSPGAPGRPPMAR